ncbi:DUF6636 domain-containing protein [Mycolicibacter arupensis]|jgi:hypothetical protein|uniref:DUF6636 domain-containing protein n=1 Tax=Mycolicibacter arupensis TaxID=342002 RepID=UPI00165EC1F8|nr:DUF6636 domain-containing protein [Mycolicibacter arupensis]
MKAALGAAAALVTSALGMAPSVLAQPEMHFFKSPSGNIACLVDADWVRCDIEERDWSPPPRPADCPSQTGYGQGIHLDAYGKPEFVCAGDTTFSPDAKTLKYGERDSSTTILCTSEAAGIRCENREGHGFVISRESYELF